MRRTGVTVAYCAGAAVFAFGSAFQDALHAIQTLEVAILWALFAIVSCVPWRER